jgi:hypothetical protein
MDGVADQLDCVEGCGVSPFATSRASSRWVSGWTGEPSGMTTGTVRHRLWVGSTLRQSEISWR